MLIAALGVLAIFSVPVTGGRLGRLTEIRLRGTGLLLGALAVQVVIISLVPGDGGALHRVAHLTTYVLALGWIVANRSVPWRWVLVLGGLCNFAAIAINGGRMPASRSALAAAGLGREAGFSNSDVVRGAHLEFLGDVFAAPSWVPLGNVFSVGDVLIVVGLVIVVHVQCGSRVGQALQRCCRRGVTVVLEPRGAVRHR
jgi:hypothetical protein